MEEGRTLTLGHTGREQGTSFSPGWGWEESRTHLPWQLHRSWEYMLLKDIISSPGSKTQQLPAYQEPFQHREQQWPHCKLSPQALVTILLCLAERHMRNPAPQLLGLS